MAWWSWLTETLGSRLSAMLSWWQWLILAAIPPAIVLLYFLKLRRRPIEVPSTFLWHKSIEDLHVNSIWQRLRRNLLMFLQLLLIVLAALALLRPSLQGRKFTEKHLIFLVDNSASMNATDVSPTRLDEARRRVGELIDEMQSGDVAMLISFADTARVEQNFTDDRRRLRQALAAIRPTERSTSLLEALRLAAGLANPGRSAVEARDVQVAEAVPADLFIFSDGRFQPVTGFSLGNLKPTFVPIGTPQAKNVAVSAFSVGRNEARQNQLQAFGRLDNFGEEDVSVNVELLLDGKMIDADRAQIAAGESRGLAFPLGDLDEGVLELRVESKDDLAVDDRAWAVISPPRRANVLLVSAGDQPLEDVLQTKLAAETAKVEVQPPAFLKDKKYENLAASGAYDLVIYDRCRPEKMPQGNTMFIGSLPPEDGWSAKPEAERLHVIDANNTHPLLQWVDLNEIKVIATGTPLEVPSGGSVLADSEQGPVMAIAPREAFEDLVLGFAIIVEKSGEGGKTAKYANTEWEIRPSFPTFVLNVLNYLGRGQRAGGQESVRPGRAVTLDAPSGKEGLRVRTPAGEKIDLPPARGGRTTFTDTAEQGVYQVELGGKTIQDFAVNLFDPVESNVRPDPNPTLKIGYVDVAGKPDWRPARRELWKWLLVLGLVVLGLEWYIYSRRVYV